ncbi:MAG TPA: heavy-metal-associated domain-containing protein [Pyrinomonadaceae bacterium]|nr:heavy-metal-associated domain-containing protein [Pyrinomonadaceae bacterium]
MLIAFIFTLTLTLGASATFAATKTVTIRVKGMTCGGCATSVEKALKSTEGVQEARVSFERGLAVIKYDDQKVTISKLREVINSTGFFCEVEGSGEK